GLDIGRGTVRQRGLVPGSSPRVDIDGARRGVVVAGADLPVVHQPDDPHAVRGGRHLPGERRGELADPIEAQDVECRVWYAVTEDHGDPTLFNARGAGRRPRPTPRLRVRFRPRSSAGRG